MKIKHWLPKLGALLASVPAVIASIKAQVPDIVATFPPEWQAALSAIGIVILGFGSKQVNTTGGTKKVQ